MSEIDNSKRDTPVKAVRKNRHKSREQVLESVYSSLLHQGAPIELQEIQREQAEDPGFEGADEEYMQRLLKGVSEHITELDRRLERFLDRKISELSPIEHAVLCIAAYELIYDPAIPYRVAINEGVELAKTYGGTDGHKYVNGVLDKLAAEARPAEFRRPHR